ncbi:Uncharacterised protein [Mycobacterium tuberculosis]|nr:Uncharacterised protein [Mycobacterium tuberculosis]
MKEDGEWEKIHRGREGNKNWLVGGDTNQGDKVGGDSYQGIMLVGEEEETNPGIKNV